MRSVLLGVFLLSLVGCLDKKEDKNELLSCAFVTANGFEEIQSCASDDSGTLQIGDSILTLIQFDSSGLASGFVSGRGCYWAKSTGELVQSPCFDNGADPFREGLARFVDSNGRMGFMDRSLAAKIPAQYDFAFPFRDGTTKVCLGCKLTSKEQSEHGREVIGGRWQIIDTNGKLVARCPGAKNYRDCRPKE